MEKSFKGVTEISRDREYGESEHASFQGSPSTTFTGNKQIIAHVFIITIYLMISSQVLCGTEPYPEHFRAKKYRLHDKFFTKSDFQVISLPLWIATWSEKSDKSCCNKLPQEMMRNLPVPVLEEDIDEMFNFADQDQDGKISWR